MGKAALQRICPRHSESKIPWCQENQTIPQFQSFILGTAILLMGVKKLVNRLYYDVYPRMELKRNDLTGSQSKLSFIEEIWPHKFLSCSECQFGEMEGLAFRWPRWIRQRDGFLSSQMKQWKRAPGWFRVSVRNEILHSYVRIVS